MIKRLTVLAVVLLAAMNVLTFIYSSQATNQIAELKTAVDKKQTGVVVFEGKNGYTPVKGVDYNDGAAGINAMSYSVQTTVVKEVPIQGERGEKGDSPDCLKLESKCVGKDGKDAADVEFRTDDYGNFQYKKTTDVFWQSVIDCNKFVGGCKE